MLRDARFAVDDEARDWLGLEKDWLPEDEGDRVIERPLLDGGAEAADRLKLCLGTDEYCVAARVVVDGRVAGLVIATRGCDDAPAVADRFGVACRCGDMRGWGVVLTVVDRLGAACRCSDTRGCGDTLTVVDRLFVEGRSVDGAVADDREVERRAEGLLRLPRLDAAASRLGVVRERNVIGFSALFGAAVDGFRKPLLVLLRVPLDETERRGKLLVEAVRCVELFG